MTIPIPVSAATVEVSIIDTTAQLVNLPTVPFYGPPLKGFDKVTVCVYAFMVTHTDTSTGHQRRLIFDLGPPRDWETDLPPAFVERIKSWGSTIEMSKYMSEILEENGVKLDSIEAIIWSHVHWDHIGRPSLFPSNVELITGPGVLDSCAPGWPTVPDCAALEREFQGRNITELDFGTSNLTIGDFEAIDYFGDGSFYFLYAPGHAVGHINALARTTGATSDPNSKSTFILMGADSFHHGSQLRPTSQVPLPDIIPHHLPRFSQYQTSCPGHLFDVIHPSYRDRKDKIPDHYGADMAEHHGDVKTTPYLTIASEADGSSLATDLFAAKKTIRGLQQFDADENVLVISAHDNTLLDLMEYFPKGANQWKEKGWKDKSRWLFLNDFKEALDRATKE